MCLKDNRRYCMFVMGTGLVSSWMWSEWWNSVWRKVNRGVRLLHSPIRASGSVQRRVAVTHVLPLSVDSLHGAAADSPSAERLGAGGCSSRCTNSSRERL